MPGHNEAASRPGEPDPDDGHALACALTAKAELIVAGDEWNLITLLLLLNQWQSIIGLAGTPRGST